MTSTIATCCRNAALMLEIADQEISDNTKCQRIQKANHRQAALLRDAALLADDTLATLHELERLGVEGMKPNFSEWLTFHDKVAQIARIAITKITNIR